MSQSPLLVRPQRRSDGLEHLITPESAGWTYVGFETRKLLRDGRVTLPAAPATERCIVVLSGKARVFAPGF